MAIRREKTLLNSFKKHALLPDCEAFSSTAITPGDYISSSTTLHQVSLVPACSHSPKFYMRCIPNSKALFGGLLGPYLSRDSAPMASAWLATLAQMVTTAAFSAWVSVIVQEVLALSPCSDSSEQVWTHHLAALVIKGKGGADLGACPHSLVTPEAVEWGTLIS